MNHSLIEVQTVRDARGNLAFIEGGRSVPFQIQRVYYIYDIPGGVERGGHAHFALNQLMIPLSGSFDVRVVEGDVEKIYTLNRANCGLLIREMVWREMLNFSSGAVCLVLASEYYDEADYIRDFDMYLKKWRIMCG